MTVAGALRVGLWRTSIAALVLLGWVVIPAALDAWDGLLARDDPAALTERGLESVLTPARLRSELEQALDADDADLAGSLLVLADQQGARSPEDMRARYATATRPWEQFKRSVGEAKKGLLEGEADSGAGLAGVVARDLSGYGDVVDLWREKEKILRGESPDRLTMALAAAGLALTGATFVSLGEALPVRTGVSAIRDAAKAGRLSRPMAAQISRILREAVDVEKLAAGAAALGRFEIGGLRAAARDAVRFERVAELRSLASDATTIARRAGLRAAQETLAAANNASELGRAARLAEARGGATRAVLKLLGRGALVLTTTSLALFGYLVAGVAYAWLAGALVLSVGCHLARAMGWLLAKAISSLVAYARAGGSGNRAAMFRR